MRSRAKNAAAAEERLDMEDEKNKTEKKQNKFAAFLKRVFVKNIGWKLLSLASAAIIWFLVAGLW